MNSQIKLGRYFGIDVGLHYSWFLIAFLLVMSLAQNFYVHDRSWTRDTVWLTAVFTGCLFFVTLILHELAHSIVARLHGIPVRSITLFALGGVSQIEKESENARTEFEIGIAGPAASLVIAVVCLGSIRALGLETAAPHAPAVQALAWLGYINLGLAFFNLIPGFPLDGGRVLRAAIWGATNDGKLATRVAARSGHWTAMAFIFLGILEFFRGAGFSGLWLAFIGWFLNSAAYETSLRSRWTDVLKGLRVGDVMNRGCPIVPGSASLETFVHDYLLRTGEPCYLVHELEGDVGIVTTKEVKHVNRSLWHTTSVRQVARRLDQLPRLTPGAPAQEAFDDIARESLDQVPVVSEGRVVGVVTRGRILEILRTRLDIEA